MAIAYLSLPYDLYGAKSQELVTVFILYNTEHFSYIACYKYSLISPT